MQKKTITSREAAYLAYRSFLEKELFLTDSLNEWERETAPSSQDFHLAQEIAYGTCQKALTLEHYAKQITNGRLRLKKKERALLFTALYQYFFLDKVPLYAIANESMQLAKKYTHTSFAGFLNALLRKLEKGTFSLPKENSAEALSISYSYPIYFVKQLLINYPVETAIAIMEAGNRPSQTMARERSSTLTMIPIKTIEELQSIKTSKDFYIQNITPALLMTELSKKASHPSAILDLCASPGGKLLLAHDLFPEAKLTANDVNEKKLSTIKENCEKYSLSAELHCGKGEDFPTVKQFDIVILDIPCSNSGVLNKRPEARWRLSQENLKALKKMQLRLLEKATSLLTPTGQIWFMTCSNLKEENEDLIQEFLKEHPFEIVTEKTILPNQEGYDGGYGCSLTLKS